MKYFVTTIMLIFITLGYAQQTGSIVGKITDKEMNNDPLPYANVQIKGTDKGATTDFDGLFEISGIEPGTYTVVLSFIGYSSLEVPNVKVEAGKVANVNASLSADSQQLEEVVVTTTARKDSEVALLLEQKNAVIMKQEIGAQELSRKGVSDAEGAVTKVTGVKKQAGAKNVFVRGLGDRYNSTTLNELPLPSEDPEYKNISLDFFSSNIIQSVGINKTFGDHIYGDVAGANIDIVTKELSKQNSLQIGISPGINTRALGKEFLIQDGASFFGSIKNKNVPITDLDVYNFDNNFKPESQNAQVNSGLSVSGGKRWDIGTNRFSMFLVGSFNNNYEYREGVSRKVSAAGGLGQDFDAKEYNYNVSKLAMGNFKFTFENGNYLALNSIFLQSTDQSVEDYYGTKANLTESDDPDNPIRAFVRRQQQNQNNLLVNQLLGKFDLTNKLKLDAGVAYNMIKGYEPDRRTNTYVIDVNADIARAASGSALNNRFYSDLTENDLTGRLYLNYKLGAAESEKNNAIRVGYNYRQTDRTFNYTQLNYILNSPTVVDMDNPDTSLFNQSSLDSNIFYLTTNRGDGRDGKDPFAPFFYKGDRTIHAGLADITYDLTEKLTVNAGVRFEKVDQSVEFDTNLASSSNPTTDPSEINKNFVLPSFNMKYSITDNSIVRLAGSKTYTLPQFKEIAPFLYEDVTFNSFGNPYLLPANNYNADLKYEYYLATDELIAITGFYKKIQNAINRIEVNSAASELSYVNTGDANIAGAELEVRKKIFGSESEDAIIKKSLSFGFNASYLYSKQELKDVGSDELTVRFTNEEDKLEGSSPVILGGDLTYNYEKDTFGVTSALVFNYTGESIYSLGTGGDSSNPGSGKSNIVHSSIYTLDLINKIALSEKVGLSLNFKNLLDPEYKLTQKVNNIGVANPTLPDGEKITLSTYKRGISFSIGFTYSF